jgi:hypothetical protein
LALDDARAAALVARGFSGRAERSGGLSAPTATVSKRLEVEKYGLDSYDDYFCLRPSWLLVLCTVFLCRGLLLFALFGLSGGVPAALREVVDAETLWQGCVAAFPAAVVLYAMTARDPAAPRFVRFSWRNGRWLLALAALSYVGLAVAQLGVDLRRWLLNPLAIALVATELAILGYLFVSSRVRQTFVEFPAA